MQKVFFEKRNRIIIIYYRGKVIGGIYDNRFLVNPTKSALAMMQGAKGEFPYEGAKDMLLVDQYLAALQRCKLDTPLLAVGSLIGNNA